MSAEDSSGSKADSDAQKFVPPPAPAFHSLTSDLKNGVHNWTGLEMSTVPKQAHNFPELFGGGGKKKKGLGAMAMTTPKNALVTLNELRPGLQFILAEQRGPIHNPTFVVHVNLNDQLYVGTGRSKKEAKHNAAEEVLKSFVQFKNTCEVQQAIRYPIPYCEFAPILVQCERALAPTSFELMDCENS